jgi:hypothetical protein
VSDGRKRPCQVRCVVSREFEKEIQFLRKEYIVIPRVEAKQWIGFTERPPANDDLGASLRDEIESGDS